MEENNNNLSRRNFVKESTLLTGGLLLAPNLFAASPEFNKTKKLKIAVVGCGGRGTGAASQALRADENVELVALADAFEDRVETLDLSPSLTKKAGRHFIQVQVGPVNHRLFFKTKIGLQCCFKGSTSTA